MKPHRLMAYSLMAAGTVISARTLFDRRQWEEANVHTAIMLDWDDVQAVAARANLPNSSNPVLDLLRLYKENGATHLSTPELTLNRLLEKGHLWRVAGPQPQRLYLQADQPDLANRVAAELQARLPHLQVEQNDSPTPVISFLGDLPTIAEVGLGFDPVHAALARQAQLRPVARPIGYSWVQPAMIERTFSQAAELGVKIIAVQGNLVPGHEFKLADTVAAMRRYGLTLAYFSQSRHQKGDWFLAKNLAADGLVVLAHEFQPAELLAEDWHTAAYRWANLAVEAGIRLCSLRFFRILHAADPLESVAYVHEVAHALEGAGLLPGHAGQVDLTPFQPRRDEAALAAAGLSIAGAAGLAADLFRLSNPIKMMGMSVAALTLTALPWLEKRRNEAYGATGQPSHHHGHSHPHFYGHHHHDHNQADHPHDLPEPHSHADHDHADHHHPEHEPHDHHDHAPDQTQPNTAYAPKGLALAAALAYPAATLALDGVSTGWAAAQTAALSAAGSVAISATVTEADSLLDIETVRNYNLDWLIPLTLAASAAIWQKPQSPNPQKLWRWLPLMAVAAIALKNLGQSPDMLATLDREHRHTHTHHMSAFQRAVGDAKMALSAQPLRKWAFLAPLGTTTASILKQQGQDDLAAAALTAAAAGQVATLAGFRNGPRPVLKTVQGRAAAGAIGAVLAGAVWLVFALFNRKRF